MHSDAVDAVAVTPHNCVFNFSDFAAGGPVHCVSLSDITGSVIVELCNNAVCFDPTLDLVLRDRRDLLNVGVVMVIFLAQETPVTSKQMLLRSFLRSVGT